MLEGGFILLHRSILRWEWYGDLKHRTAVHSSLLTVNYEPQRWQGIAVERGQRVASLAKAGGRDGADRQSRCGRRWNILKRTGEVTHTATSKYGLFTVNHYDRYQPRGEPEGTRPGMENGIQGAGGGQAKGSNGRKNKKQRKRAKRARPRRGRNGPAAKCRRNARGAPAERDGTGRRRCAAGTCVRDGRRRGYGCGKAAGAGGQSKFGEFENVLLDGREHGKLVDSLGDTGASEYIERLSVYLAQTGRCYKSHYAAILNWWRRDGMPVRRSPAPRVLKPDVGREITPDMTAEELF